MATAKTEYIPGTCNINFMEIAKRKQLGQIGVATFMIVFVGLLIMNIDHFYRVVLFLPAFMAASGYLQARNRFCVGYAAAGKQNDLDGSEEAIVVIEKAARKADMRKALLIHIETFVIATIVTALAIAIPNL